LQRNTVKGASAEHVESCQFRIKDQLSDRFWGIFWIDASSEDNIERSLVNIAAVCGLASEANVFRRWLSNLPETWLMIFDNADDPNLDLSQYFPVGARGTILITTRNPECRHHAPIGSSWELQGMAVEEAIVLILKVSGVDDVSNPRMRDIAKPVVLTLGCLALAVAQAGAVIRQGVCGMDEYCELYSQRRKELLSYRSIQGKEEYKYTVYTTWEISLGAIEAMSDAAAGDAMELLQMFGFLHHEGISEEIFRRAWTNLWNEGHSDWIKRHQLHMLLRQRSTEWDPQALRKAISILSSFSLINRDKNGLVSMHPLVHRWARDRLGRSDEERKWTLTVSTIAVSISWTFQTDDYRFRQSLIPHLDACLRVYDDGIFRLEVPESDSLNMAERFAIAYKENGRRQEALELTEKVMAARKRTLGEEHPGTLSSMQSLAIRYSEVGRRQEALELVEKVMAARKRTLGEEHPDTLRSMHNLAIHYGEVGRRQEALELTEKVAVARKRTLGEEYPETLSSMHSLAIRYSEVGRRQEAVELAEKVMVATKRTLGEEHPDTLHSMHSLANGYSEVGRRQEALELTEKVLAARKRTLGEEHPDTFSSMDDLAIRYSEVGRRQEAVELAEKVMAARKGTLGEEHPDTLRSMHNLAIHYGGVGRRQEALELVEKVMAATKRTLGEEHPDTLRSMHSLAIRYSEVGRREETLELTEKVVVAMKRTLGEEHPDTLGSMHSLAICYSEVGRRKETLELTEKVVAAMKRTLGEEHPDTLRSMHSLANGYSEVGRQEEALELTEKVVVAMKRALGEEHPDTLGSMHSLANRYSEVGRRQEALELKKKVVAVRKRTQGKEYPDTLLSHGNLAILETIPGPSAELPWQHSASKKSSSGHTTDKLNARQKKRSSRFQRKLL
jgi:tetratricopeptide (TPR) repeat protein